VSRLIVTNVETQNIKFDSDTTAFNINSSGAATLSNNATIGGTLGVTGATTLSSSITTATGHNFVPEFISNGYVAGNSASTINITDALDQSKYAIHRIVGTVAGSWSTGNTHVFMRFLRNNDITQVTDAHYHYALNNDTSAGAGGFGEQNVTYWRITRQSATTLMVPFDMYIYHQHGINFMRGHSAYHDQSTNRGYSEFGGIYHGTHTLTGLLFASTAGNNTGSMNISIYGYRFRQNNASKFNGAVGI